MSNEPNAYDETGVLPNAAREDGVLLWHCPNCLSARSVTAKRHEGSKVYQRVAIEGLDDSTAYVWSCGVCAKAWTQQNFILACNDEAELGIFVQADMDEAILAERKACAEVARNVVGGFTANVRVSENEQEMVRDPDGPWVLNSEVAKAILARGSA